MDLKSRITKAIDIVEDAQSNLTDLLHEYYCPVCNKETGKDAKELSRNENAWCAISSKLDDTIGLLENELQIVEDAHKA